MRWSNFWKTHVSICCLFHAFMSFASFMTLQTCGTLSLTKSTYAKWAELKVTIIHFFQVCDALDCRLVVPEAKLCTDNGVMIAWNGLERYRAAQPGSGNLALQSSAIYPPDRVFEITTASKVPFGIDISKEVTEAHIKCKWINILWKVIHGS